MRVNKAKRRLVRWYRYVHQTGSQTTNKHWHPLYHRGHTKAYHDVMYARRWYPKGLREPWVLTTYRSGT